jgi:hypothetical protein
MRAVLWLSRNGFTVLVVDGSFLQRAELRDHWDEVIYFGVAFEVALARGVARDAAALGGRDAATDREPEGVSAGWARDWGSQGVRMPGMVGRA